MSGESREARTIVEAFEASAALHAERPAVWDRGAVLTYAELRRRALRVGGRLSSLGVGTGDVVCVNLAKSADLVASMLGIWYAGAAYMPLDPALPRERQKALADRGSPKAFVVGEPDGAGLWGGARAVVEAPWESPVDPARAPRLPGADDLAYVIFTSGSTGRPKGVMVEHAGLPAMLFAQIEAFRLRPGSRSLFYLSTAFDASISDVGTALLSGATLYIEDPRELSPERILGAMARHAVTHADLPPSLLPHLDPSRVPESLEAVIIGGEICPAPVVREWAGRVRLVNVYGPTEATICASLCVCGHAWERPSIGKPLPGVTFELIVPDGKPAPPGEVGELHITGRCVARGYLGEPGLSAEKFSARDGRRSYKTGDLARMLADGSFEFAGRADRQLKLRGQLVEPAEIEARLMESGRVAQAAVLRRALEGGEALVAFVVPRPADSPLTPGELRARLASALPRWMIPSSFVSVEALPLNPVGKIDYAALALLPVPARASFEPPLPGLETEIASLFSSALGGRGIGRHDDFFELGGDSLALLRLGARAAEAGIRIEPELLYSHPTVESLSARLARGSFEPPRLTRGEADTLSALDDRSLDLLQAAEPPARGRPSRVLITGAAGFFGSRLLAELLRRGVEEAVCIVRADSDEEAGTRIAGALRAHGLEDAPVRALAGDVSLPCFGLARGIWDALCSSIDTIFHSAAEVSIVKSYPELEAANVGATREALRFALSGRPKELHHVSTLSVLLNADFARGSLGEDCGADGIGWVEGGYAQSKWVAELLLLAAREAGYEAISIHRLGLVTGDSATGRSKSGDLLSLVVKSLVETGAAPAERRAEISFDVTPCDYAARALVEIAFSAGAAARGVFHLSGRHKLSLAELCGHMRSFGLYVDMIPASEWRELAARRSGEALDAALMAMWRCLSDDGAYRALDLFQATGVSFDTSRTDSIVAGSGLRCPAPDERLIHRYLRSLCEEPGFFGTAPERTAPPERRRAPSGCLPEGLARSDLYDAFLFKAPETPRILGFHMRELSERGIARPARLLEIGCGTGRLLRAFLQISERVDGIDPDEEYLERARGRCRDLSPRISLRKAGFSDLDAEEVYGMVTSVNGPLFYLPGPAERDDALRRIGRALAPGGLLILDLANFSYLLRHYGGEVGVPIERKVGRFRVRREMRHTFDFHDSLWIHDDLYEVRPDGEPDAEPARYAERHVFSMITRPEIGAALERAGFEDVRWFEGWDADGPGRCSGARLLISAVRR